MGPGMHHHPKHYPHLRQGRGGPQHQPQDNPRQGTIEPKLIKPANFNPEQFPTSWEFEILSDASLTLSLKALVLKGVSYKTSLN